MYLEKLSFKPTLEQKQKLTKLSSNYNFSSLLREALDVVISKLEKETEKC